MPYFCVTPHVVNKYASVGRVSKNLFKRYCIEFMIFWVEKQINLAMDGRLPTCAWNRVSVPVCEHQHESQDTRHPIVFGLSCCL
jgi:hypothetical protein